MSLSGELNIQSIPSEVELVTEKNGTKIHQGQGNSESHYTTSASVTITKVLLGSSSDATLSVQPSDQGGTMLWKRIRHTVVFGSKVAKQKKSKN